MLHSIEGRGQFCETGNRITIVFTRMRALLALVIYNKVRARQRDEGCARQNKQGAENPA